MVTIGVTDYYGIDSSGTAIILVDMINNIVSSVLKTSICDVDSFSTINGIPKRYSISTLL